jgi:hypothetical protein
MVRMALSELIQAAVIESLLLSWCMGVAVLGGYHSIKHRQALPHSAAAACFHP